MLGKCQKVHPYSQVLGLRTFSSQKTDIYKEKSTNKQKKMMNIDYGLNDHEWQRCNHINAMYVCAQSCLTLAIPWIVAHQPPLSMEFSISPSRGSSQPRDRTSMSCVLCIDRWILYHWTTWCCSQGQIFLQSQPLETQKLWPFYKESSRRNSVLTGIQDCVLWLRLSISQNIWVLCTSWGPSR